MKIKIFINKMSKLNYIEFRNDKNNLSFNKVKKNIILFITILYSLV